LPNFPYEIDLAADQCTIYYTSYSATATDISRYNVCTSQPLTPLVTGLPPLAFAASLRILPGQDVLLGGDNRVLRISPNGATTRIYQGTAQIALDPDGESFWTADGLDSVSKIDLATGNTVTRSTTFGGFPIVDSLTVVGEPRAAVLAPESIPVLSEWLLVALAAAVGAIAVFRLHR